MSDNTGAILILGIVLSTAIATLTYSIGNQRGQNYGVSTTHLIMEQDAINHDCGEYYFDGNQAKFRWKK